MEIKGCSQEYWDLFVDASAQGTVFNKSFFLKSYGHPVSYLICYKGEEVVAGFGLVKEGDNIRPMPYSVLGGIIFKDLVELNNYRRNETIFMALEAFAQYLFDHYTEVDFTNHWDITDMRAFDWVNYHDRQKGYYQIFPRYTSLLDISDPANTDGYARKRIRELDKGVDEGYKFFTRGIDDISLLSRLHEMNFIRQGITRSEEEKRALVHICENLMNAQAGTLLATYVNDEPAVVSFFVYDQHRAYHLFVGADLDLKDLGVGTKNFYDSCLFLNSQLGYKELDLVGANSPLRSNYKLSYGGRLVPYFRIKKVPPQGQG
ncbi:MAG: GNAT family N-acetyltransferase [Candidatus Omnitrophica bacterium]|nr:GNAT family N-acetyltransferase [Candidatus Omnitrophota bacterium]